MCGKLAEFKNGGNVLEIGSPVTCDESENVQSIGVQLANVTNDNNDNQSIKKGTAVLLLKLCQPYQRVE